jgi:CBS domain-containing protein
MGARPAPRPIRRRVVVDGGGAEVVDALVPCARQDALVPLAECSACARSAALPIDPLACDAVVVCEDEPAPAPRPIRSLDPSERALRTPVSLVAEPDVLALLPTTRIDVARALLDQRGAMSLAVVDEDRRPLGFVGRIELEGQGGERVIGAHVVPFATAVCEDTPLVLALPALLGREAALPIVTTDGTLASVLAPVDVVRWLARAAGYEL